MSMMGWSLAWLVSMVVMGSLHGPMGLVLTVVVGWVAILMGLRMAQKERSERGQCR